MSPSSYDLEVAIQNLHQRTQTLEKVVAALLELGGPAVVESKMLEMHNQRLVANAEKQKKELELLVAEGKVVKAEVVNEKSLLVGQETDKNGAVTSPGRHQLEFAEIAPAFQEKLLGKAVGAVVEIPDKGTFTLNEIYQRASVSSNNTIVVG